MSLRLAEPDANLFDEGASYSELSPSERVHRKLERLGIPDTDEGLRRWYERADKVYSENR